jgi:hypothetical protein
LPISLRNLRKKDLELEASLGYVARPLQKKSCKEPEGRKGRTTKTTTTTRTKKRNLE